jgi:hypothetical protein
MNSVSSEVFGNWALYKCIRIAHYMASVLDKAKNSAFGKKLQSNKLETNINYVRAVVSFLTYIFALSTLIVFGQMMDYANFPGSNIQFQNVSQNYALKASTCSNFRPITNGDTNKVCGSVQDETPTAIDILTGGNSAPATEIAHGWLVVPPCAKSLVSGQPKGDCSPFSNGSAVAVLGGLTFVLLALGAGFFGLHTAIIDNDTKKKSGWRRAFFYLNLVWAVLSFALSMWAAIAWVGMCDKLDTGLGRFLDGPVASCATQFCTMSFESFTVSFVTAIVVACIPNLLILTEFCGVASVASKKEVEKDSLI